MFKKVLILAILAAFAYLAAINRTEIGNYYRQQLNTREIVIKGNNLLTQDEILELLPARNNLFWKYSPERISKLITDSHPLLLSATVSGCRRDRLRCFIVEVQENRPSFAYRPGGQQRYWLVDRDGKFLVPASAEVLRSQLQKIVLLESDHSNRSKSNQETEKDSSELKRLIALYNKLTTKTSEQITRITILQNRKIELALAAVPFPIVITDFMASDFALEGRARLQIELERFALARSRLAQGEQEIVRLDLTFLKQAVAEKKQKPQ